jgi:flagellar biosynthetic protein FliQ
MDETQIIELIRHSIVLTMEIGAPVMLVGLVVGVVVALFQALTQIQEMTLVFVPKILAMFVALIVLLPFMTNTLVAFMRQLADQIVAIQ